MGKRHLVCGLWKQLSTVRSLETYVHGHYSPSLTCDVMIQKACRPLRTNSTYIAIATMCITPTAPNAPAHREIPGAAALLVAEGEAVGEASPAVFPTVGLAVPSPPVTDTLVSAGPGPTSVAPATLLLPTFVGALLLVASNVFVALLATGFC